MLNRLTTSLVKSSSKNVRNLRMQRDLDAFGNFIQETPTVVYDTTPTTEEVSTINNNSNRNAKFAGVFAAASAIGYAFFSSTNNSTTTQTPETTQHLRPLQKRSR